MKKNKILYYFVIYFLFFISYSNCHPMEDFETEQSSHSDYSSSEDVDNRPEAAGLLANVQHMDSQKPTRTTKLAALLVAIPAVTGAFIVMAPFANLTGYLFHDGISPVIDNRTCTYADYASPSFATQNPLLLNQNATAIFLDTLYTGGIGLVAGIGGGISAYFGGGSWLVDKARSIQQGFRNFCWSDQKVSQKENDNLTIQRKKKSEEKKGCCSGIPKRFKTLNYYMYSRPVEVVNGLFWSEFYFNFISTALIANYQNDPILGQVWGYLFASIAVPFVYHLYTHVTGEANKRSFHRQDNQDHAQDFVLTLLKMMDQEEIQNQKVQPFKVISRPDIASKEELENAWKEVLSLIDDDNLQKVKATEQMKTKYSRIVSFAFQGVQLPFKIFAQYMLTRKFCWALGASPDLAWKIATPVTAVLAPFLGLGSLREQSLLQYELYQVPEYFSWPQSGYAVATRTGGIIAASANIFYWATPTWYAYQREILYDIYCHQYLNYLHLNDLRVRALLAALFSIPAWCVGKQFFECQFNRIIEMVASMRCCSGASEENSDFFTEKEKRDLMRAFQRTSYLLRKSQYILDKKSYGLDESTALIQY